MTHKIGNDKNFFSSISTGLYYTLIIFTSLIGIGAFRSVFACKILNNFITVSLLGISDIGIGTEKRPILGGLYVLLIIAGIFMIAPLTSSLGLFAYLQPQPNSVFQFYTLTFLSLVASFVTIDICAKNMSRPIKQVLIQLIDLYYSTLIFNQFAKVKMSYLADRPLIRIGIAIFFACLFYLPFSSKIFLFSNKDKHEKAENEDDNAVLYSR